MKRTSAFLLLILLIGVNFIHSEISLGENISEPSSLTTIVQKPTFPYFAYSYTDRGVIEIANDGDFTAGNGVVSGDGSALTPYVINGWNITTLGGTVGISIHDTTAHFIVSNCLVSTQDQNGIFINNVALGTVTIVNNTCLNNLWGFVLYYSDDAIVENNVFSNSTQYGIILFESDRALLSNNTCIHNLTGQYIYNSPSATIINNTCSWNSQYNFYITSGSINSHLEDNSINYGLINGLRLSDDSCSLIGNEFIGNYNYAITCLGTNNTINDNFFKNNKIIGVSVNNPNTTLENNVFENCGMVLDFSFVSDYTTLNQQGNTVNGLPLGLLIDEQDQEITTLYGQLVLVNCSNIVVNEQDYSNCTIGIFMFECYNCEINNCILSNNQFGINGAASPHSTIYNNTCENIIDGNAIFLRHSANSTINLNYCQNVTQDQAIRVFGSDNYTISDNFCHNIVSGGGIFVGSSDHTTISGNRIVDMIDSIGIEMDSSHYCIVIENNIKNIEGDYQGISTYDTNDCEFSYNVLSNIESEVIYIEGSSDTVFHHNYFINNANGSTQAEDDGTDNFWYDVSTSEGNYWSDWNGTGTYTLIGAGAVDLFPLILNFTLSSFPDIAMEYGITANLHLWTISVIVPISETTPVDYLIYQDDLLVESGSLIDSADIYYNFNGSDLGSYNFTVVASDQFGYSSVDTVFVTVEDLTDPIITSPGDIEQLEGETSYSITWVAMDHFPDTYEVTRNGTVVASGSWLSGENITVTGGDLEVGLHEFTITVTDESGNTASDTVNVRKTAGIIDEDEDDDFCLICWILLLLLIIIILVIIYYFWKKKKEEAPLEEEDEEKEEEEEANEKKTNNQETKPSEDE